MRLTRRSIDETNRHVSKIIAEAKASGLNWKSALHCYAAKLEVDGMGEVAGLMFTLLASMEGNMDKAPGINVYGNVGNMNLGRQIGIINASADTLGGEGKAFADAIKAMAAEINDLNDIRDDKKGEALEAVESLVAQAKEPRDKRSTFTYKSALAYLPTVLSSSAAGIKIWEVFGPTIKGFFNA